jgi:hypothetical protein
MENEESWNSRSNKAWTTADASRSNFGSEGWGGILSERHNDIRGS